MKGILRALAPFLLPLGIAAAAADRPENVPALTPREQAVHVLNRLGFGPRPGDVDRVLRRGVTRYLDEQLHPERLDDSRTESLLRRLPTLSMSAPEIFERYQKPVLEARRLFKARMQEDGKEAGDATGPAPRKELFETIPPERRPRRALEELQSQKLLRAVFSERQLNEVMVDFWMNHFNVFAGKGPEKVFLTPFERDVLRPRLWGKFPDLVLATAKSPAMLFYLDNALSVAPPENRPAGRFAGFRSVGGGPRRAGLNENYARELMELHTLGVDGGYTQKDVTELARLLTGWSISRGRGDRGEPGSFLFRARAHDAGAKTLLDHRFSAGGGEEEGERALRMLALRPATARHIAAGLCRRLVADDPPEELVERVARRFLDTSGDLRETVSEILHSPEFFDPRFAGAKVKSPFVLAASSLRALGTPPETLDRPAVIARIATMGEPLYLCQPPTGYSNESSAWVGAGALTERINFVLSLVAGPAASRLPALADPNESRDADGMAEALAWQLTGRELSASSRRAIQDQLRQPPTPSGNATLIGRIAGLILGSPEFQKM